MKQFQKSIKIVRTDNGTEFTNASFSDLFKAHGIIHHKTCAYIVVVERKHKHLLLVVRALMFHSNLSKKFWGEAILTATNIINRTPRSLLKWKTLHEILFKRPPDYNHLKVFGSLCFAINTLPKKDKFDSRDYKCVRIGYVPEVKAYKLYHLAEHKIILFQDVQFYEHLFAIPKKS